MSLKSSFVQNKCIVYKLFTISRFVYIYANLNAVEQVQINIDKSRQTVFIMTILLSSYTYIQMEIAMRAIPNSISHALRENPKTLRTTAAGPSERVF